MTQQVCLCIHGHFYQPPRENPWIEAVEFEGSAAPWHDWNERIHRQCYRPNTRAHLLHEDRTLVGIVNNFETMSFNVGPTLMSWFEDHHPETHRLILEGDRRSIENHHGHGNAIAQVYNHMILPLADDRDKVTQVRWGIADFRRRFAREPEGMWLAETAVNNKTLEVLIGEGIRFTILAPEQARCVRPMVRSNEGWMADMTSQWCDVSFGGIDPRRPYRFFSTERPGRHVDIFFYDGPVSKALGFDDLGCDPALFMERLEGARDAHREGSQLVHVATDGEIYGHHKPFGDRTLAQVLRVEAPRRGWRIVNYGEYLEENPPTVEVRLKAGPDGEGTSWSCEHGVRRWRAHCGCRGYGPPEWNQEWREPLRRTLDWLRDELAAVFEREGGVLLDDVWEARNDYVHVVADRSETSFASFLDRHGVRPLALEDRWRLAGLMEMERHAMLMFTSCGWFYTELSGPETSQILRYAARAIQLCRDVSGLDLEAAFLERIGAARSNMDRFEDGRGVYRELVAPRIASLERIVRYYALTSFFGRPEFRETGEGRTFHCYDLDVRQRRQDNRGDVRLDVGEVTLRSRLTRQERSFGFAVARIGDLDVRCFVKPREALADFEATGRDLFDGLHRHPTAELLLRLESRLGEASHGLNDLLVEDRAKIVDHLAREALEAAVGSHEKIFEATRRLCEFHLLHDLKIPEELLPAARAALKRRFRTAVHAAAGRDYASHEVRVVTEILDTAERYGIEMDAAEIARFLSADLASRARDFKASPRPTRLLGCLNLLDFSREIAIEVDLAPAQDELFAVIASWREDRATFPPSLDGSEALLHRFARELKLGDFAP